VSELLSPAEAAGLIQHHCQRLPTETVDLSKALGRVLAEDILAERDSPPFDRVAMDGIAIRYGDLSHTTSFKIVGVAAAGHPAPALTDPFTTVEVMTGAMLPQGADTVIPVEQLDVRAGMASLTANPTITQGQNIHRQGLDVVQGTRVLSAHARLGIADLAIAASANQTSLTVAAQPKVLVVTTGDELIEPGRPIEAWQIRRSNVHAIKASLHNQGLHTVHDDHLADHFEGICARLASAFAAYDVIILSGGVSAGRFDFVPKALQHLGATAVFHKIAQRPGKPLWFGVAPSGALLFGLPGNPVSTAVCMARYVRPSLDRLQGRLEAEHRAVLLETSVHNPSALTLFNPVMPTSHGTFAIKSTQGSGDFHALQGTVGCVEIPPNTSLAAHSLVELYPW